MKKIKPICFFLLILLVCCIYRSNAQQAGVEKTRRFVDSLINVFPKEKNDSAKGLIAMNIAQKKMGGAQNTGNWDEAIEWAHKGVYYSKKGNFKLGIRRCNWQLGTCWKFKANYPEAIRHYTEFLKAALEENLAGPIVGSNTWIGDCYMLLGDYQKALKNFQAGLKICEERPGEIYDRETLQAGLIMKIGDSYSKLNNFSLAISYYKKLLSKDEQTDSTGEIHYKIALAQIGMKNYDEAVKNLQIAIQRLPRQLDFKSAVAYDTAFKGILGSYYMQIGDAYCKMASIQKGAESVLSYKNAINYLNKSVPLLKEGASGKEDLMNAYALLKQACEGVNDYENGLLYTNLYDHLKDSIYNKPTYLKLADLQVKFETEKAAAEMKINQEKEKIKQDALRDKMVADQKLEDQRKSDSQRSQQEKAFAIAKEKTNSENLLAVEKIKNEKKQTNTLLLMGLILIAVTSTFLILYLRQKHQKKMAVEKAETVHQMAELEMQSLRAQLNPHFMFNSLNAIQELILKEDNDNSHIYLSRFSELLRILLDNANQPFVSLRKELVFLELYLSLEKLRIPDLEYSFSVEPDVDAEKIMIPNMMLQPYIENAIWHGLLHKKSNRKLQVRIHQNENVLLFEIEDNGVGRKKAIELKSLYRKEHKSKGMELLSKRFSLLSKEYDTDIQTHVTDLTVNGGDAAGTLVELTVPLSLTEKANQIPHDKSYYN